VLHTSKEMPAKKKKSIPVNFQAKTRTTAASDRNQPSNLMPGSNPDGSGLQLVPMQPPIQSQSSVQMSPQPAQMSQMPVHLMQPSVQMPQPIRTFQLQPPMSAYMMDQTTGSLIQQSPGYQHVTHNNNQTITGTAVDRTSDLRTANLANFDGSQNLDLFLDRFHESARFFNWTEPQKFFFLKSLLKGSPEQLVWSQKPADLLELEMILQTSYGVHALTERIVNQLHLRKLQEKETLQMLYSDIKSQLTMAYPGEVGKMYEDTAKNLFIQALPSRLGEKVRDSCPSTIEDALLKALKFESFGWSVCDEDGRKPTKIRRIEEEGSSFDVRRVEDQRSPKGKDSYDEIKDALENMRAECKSLRAECQSLRQANQTYYGKF
jgi:hypothetical protein